MPQIRITLFASSSVTALFLIACTSGPRNPVLDTYPAAVMGQTTVTYYDIHGRTLEELRSDMRRLGPKVNGASFVGETRSPMRWRWRTESIGTSMCMIQDVTVSVAAVITLPRWNPPSGADADLVTAWNRFLGALETHEAGHKDISARAGRDIVTKLRGMSGFCSQMSATANDVARAIVDRATEEQREYDDSTRHGLTQGTSFGARRRLLNKSDSVSPTKTPELKTLGVSYRWTLIPEYDAS